MKGLRIKYLYNGKWYLSGLIKPSQSESQLKAYQAQYKKSKIVNHDEDY